MEVTPWNPVSRLGVALMALAPLSWWSAYLIQDAPLLKVALFCAGVFALPYGMATQWRFTHPMRSARRTIQGQHEALADAAPFDPETEPAWPQSQDLDNEVFTHEGKLNGRRFKISHRHRPIGSFVSTPDWEPVSVFDTDVKDARMVYDTCIEVALDGPHLDRLGGFTSVNVKTAEAGFDGSVWEDEQLPYRAVFVGVGADGLPALGADLLNIGPGFRFTISKGRCFLDARAPGYLYSAEDILAAVDWVGGLEARLNAALADPYADPTALPLNMLVHLADQAWSVDAYEAIRDRVVNGPAQEGRYPALVWLLYQSHRRPLDPEDLRTLLARDDLTHGEYRSVFKRGEPSEALLLEVLSGFDATHVATGGAERAILDHLAQHGRPQVAQTLGETVVTLEAAQAPNARIDRYRAARAKIAARAGGEHAGVLSIVHTEDAAGGMALAEEDGLDRARKRVETLVERGDPMRGDEKDHEP